MSVFNFLKKKASIKDKIVGIFNKEIDEELYEELLEGLILSDVSFKTASKIIEDARRQMPNNIKSDYDKVVEYIINSAKEILDLKVNECQFPAIILMLGVNGVGKTSTIAKLANMYKKEGKKVLLVAADTFRAAACEQLETWANRLDVPIIKSSENQDPSSVIFDGISSGKAKKYDVVICDTAGRLQNKKNLMDELAKIYRVAENNKDNFNIYSYLVLDAMSGQNSINQMDNFLEVAKISGIIMTKLDSTSKGGTILSICDEFKIPVEYICIGETKDDIIKFNYVDYLNAIFY